MRGFVSSAAYLCLVTRVTRMTRVKRRVLQRLGADHKRCVSNRVQKMIEMIRNTLMIQNYYM
jgi:hypothetical protein